MLSRFKSQFASRALLAGLLGTCSATFSALADPNPVLTSTSYYTNEGRVRAKELELKSLDIRMQVSGGYVETTLMSEFYNPGENILEGEFTFDMPAGATLIGYGLDINGEIRDGVIVEKKQAERAFNDRIRRGVDPGLAETTRSNEFKTRVFPINPGQTRQISLTFVTPGTEASPFRLPLESETEPARISIMASGDISPDVLSLPGKFVPEWSEDGRTATLVAEDLPLDGAITLQASKLPDVSLTRHSSGGPMLSFNLPAGKRQPMAPNAMRVFWDTSLSQQETARKSLDFLTEIVDQNRPFSIELVSFDQAPNRRRALRPEPEELDYFVSELRYDGATDLSALYAAETERAEVDICFLVTNGRSTLGDIPNSRLPCRLYVISASPDSDDGVLSLLAKQGGGQYIDLDEISADTAIERMGRAIRSPKRLLVDGKNMLPDAEWQDDGDRFRLVVPVDPSAKTYRLDVDDTSLSGPIDTRFATRNDGPGTEWASLRLTSDRARGASREDLVALSREYSVVSDETSLLVLETLQDYVEQGLELPANTFSKGDRQLWAELMERNANREEALKNARLDTVLALWQQQVDWYEGKIGKGVNGTGMAMDAASPPPPSSPPPPTPPSPPPPPPGMPSESAQELVRMESAEARSAEEEDIIVTGSQVAREAPQDELANRSELVTINWSPDRPYLKSAIGLCGTELYAHYFEQRDEFGSVPAYFLEMADLFARCGETQAAVKIILTALELPVANDDTLTAISLRLVRYGEYDTAISLLRQVVARDPVRPQPYRNLALALSTSATEGDLSKRETRARLEEALQLLNHIIETPTDEAFDGIESISILEANRVLKKLREAGGEGQLPNYNLEYEMPVDLRVVVNWNIDEADMDLWVREPGGEVAKYDNPLTDIGGRLSNDMTNGYGPEEYLLKAAPDGTFEILMDYFSSDIVNPNGAVGIQAEIWRDYGKPTESVERVELEFTDDEQDEYLIARLKVGED